MGDGVDPKAGMDAVEKRKTWHCPCPESNLDSSAAYPVAPHYAD
jgi:hypothetical protein